MKVKNVTVIKVDDEGNEVIKTYACGHFVIVGFTDDGTKIIEHCSTEQLCVASAIIQNKIQKRLQEAETNEQ